MSARRPGRRQALGSALSLAALAALGGVGRQAAARSDARALRPPGALDEPAFDAACVRCGRCVQACPVGTLRLADLGAPVAPGTPYFRARAVPCAMCEDVPCRDACPSGALSPSLARIEDARIGTARLAAPERCFSATGVAACVACVRACPLGTRAIVVRRGPSSLGVRLRPEVDPEVCTGCGRCEHACLASRAAIVVTARGAAVEAGA